MRDPLCHSLEHQVHGGELEIPRRVSLVAIRCSRASGIRAEVVRHLLYRSPLTRNFIAGTTLLMPPDFLRQLGLCEASYEPARHTGGFVLACEGPRSTPARHGPRGPPALRRAHDPVTHDLV